MPIGTNKVTALGAGGAGSSAAFISASGGSTANTTHPDTGVPIRIHTWQSSGSSTFSVQDVTGSGEGTLWIWAWGGAGGNGGQSGAGGGSGGFAYGQFEGVTAGTTLMVLLLL